MFRYRFATERLSLQRSLTMIVPGLLVLVACFAIYVTMLMRGIDEQRIRVEHDTYLRAAQMSNLLAQQMEALVSGLDYALKDLANSYQAGNKLGFEEGVATMQNTFPEGTITQISIADARGTLLYSSLGSLRNDGQVASIRDRRHFTVHATGTFHGLYISDPVFGRLSRQYTIQFSRALYRDFEFAGVIVLSVSPRYLSSLFHKVFDNSSDVVMLLNQDGYYLARSLDEDQAIGKHVPTSRTFLQDPGKTHGTYETTAALDDIERYYAWSRVASYPLIISLGLDKAQATTESEHAITRILTNNTIGGILILIASLWISYLLLQREKSVAMLTDTARRQSAIINHFPGGVLVEDQDGNPIVANQTLCRLLALDINPDSLTAHTREAFRERAPQGMLDWIDQPLPPTAQDIDGAALGLEYELPDGRTLEIDRIGLDAQAQHLGTLWLLKDITERKLRERKLETLATRDSLTGLTNRGAFMNALAHLPTHHLLHGPDRQPTPAAMLVMIDIDHFKRVNDTYGHHAGDQALSHLADILRVSLRAHDLAGRLGGEEFVLLLPDTSLAQSIDIAERIRLAIAEQPAHTDAGEVSFTASFGIATLSSPPNPETCLEQADSALYLAKRSGRNCVCYWSQDSGKPVQSTSAT
ncbi:sensor domain-containing diguanylate cyclase [Corticimicrobacter populi]|uniref:diguanylate cyclase n=1 Tax=Corticimicrobacter populi TaxID=2175229 RepID=A0A2V1K0I3_9BURK|nr:diguanylate cyclase [Corticimicrobacter populi]PWF23174.1 hypothetical protein DD235_09295 [Corticimicrobacter populi]